MEWSIVRYTVARVGEPPWRVHRSGTTNHWKVSFGGGCSKTQTFSYQKNQISEIPAAGSREMTPMRTFSKLSCAVLAGDDEMSTASTRAFWIDNRTSERITLVRVAGVGGDLLPDDSWPDNPVLEPGQNMRIEVTSGGFR